MGYVPVDAYFDDEQNISADRHAPRNGSGRPTRAPAASAKKPAANRGAVVPAKKKAPAGRAAAKKESSSLTVRGKKLLRQVMSTKNNVRVTTVKSEKKKPLPLTAIFMAILCTGLLMFMVVSYVQINEYTVEVANLRNELNDMMDRDKEL